MLALRHKMAALIGALVLVSTICLTGGAASAQTGYPPGTSTTVPACIAGNVDAGTLKVGQTATFTLCGVFTPGGTVNVTVNGTQVFAKTPLNGAVVVTVTVLSTTEVAVGDPVNVAITCGTTNKVIATGAGTPGTSTGTFAVLCASTTSTTTSGGLAFTGANVLLAILIALALIVLGTVLVLMQRRRRQTI